MIRLAAALLALALAAGPAAAETAKPPVDRNGMLILTRSALAALDQANKTGNYTVLRDLGGPAFQANTAARLGEIFAGLRQEGLDLTPALVMEPVITVPPQTGQGGVMKMAGYFPTYPRQINFQVAYQPVAGAWKLYGVSISTSAPAPSPTTPKPPG